MQHKPNDQSFFWQCSDWLCLLQVLHNLSVLPLLKKGTGNILLEKGKLGNAELTGSSSSVYHIGDYVWLTKCSDKWCVLLEMSARSPKVLDVTGRRTDSARPGCYLCCSCCLERWISVFWLCQWFVAVHMLLFREQNGNVVAQITYLLMNLSQWKLGEWVSKCKYLSLHQSLGKKKYIQGQHSSSICWSLSSVLEQFTPSFFWF